MLHFWTWLYAKKKEGSRPSVRCESLTLRTSPWFDIFNQACYFFCSTCRWRCGVTCSYFMRGHTLVARWELWAIPVWLVIQCTVSLHCYDKSAITFLKVPRKVIPYNLAWKLLSVSDPTFDLEHSGVGDGQLCNEHAAICLSDSILQILEANHHARLQRALTISQTFVYKKHLLPLIPSWCSGPTLSKWSLALWNARTVLVAVPMILVACRVHSMNPR